MPQQRIIPGIHHVTAITADAQANIDFYTAVLGLRLVKLTVNFDDPGSYHLYYGDESGRPGSIMTFFDWPGANRGRVGPPQVTATAFAVPADSLPFWTDRLQSHKIPFQRPSPRWDDRVLSLADPDGLPLELIATAKSPLEPWNAGPVPAPFAIRGFHGVTISEEGYENTAKLLTEQMNFKSVASEQNRYRYQAGSGNAPGSTIDLVCVPGARHGNLGAGTVHHVAFRTADDDQQRQWRDQIIAAGHNVSPVMDRVYFHSIYYREPGGVLFEIATDNPGFTLDEPLETLGTRLRLPPWLEPHRAQIERFIPPVRLPGAK